MISIQNQLVGAQEGQRMTLECNSEAFPQSINYWTKENNEIIKNGTSNIYISLDIFFFLYYSLISIQFLSNFIDNI